MLFPAGQTVMHAHVHIISRWNGDVPAPRCLEGHLWLEQNARKRLKWERLAREGHDVSWEFNGPGGAYTGRMLIDGERYTPSEATKIFLQA